MCRPTNLKSVSHSTAPSTVVINRRSAIPKKMPPPPEAFAFAHCSDVSTKDKGDEYNETDEMYMSDEDKEDQCDSSFDDCDSSYHTAASQESAEDKDEEESEQPHRCVRFSSDPVLTLNFRPYTEQHEKKDLHYSKRDIKEFRKQFRAKMKEQRAAPRQEASDTPQASTMSLSSQLWSLLSMPSSTALPSSNGNSSAALLVDTLYLF
mmetsp:Transcript_49587/g.149454  ORF Transcript_49587/g.149454 Transcript_49587/m.149454 type:complete len:207 (-) Transcript_49587:144-764(-)